MTPFSLSTPSGPRRYLLWEPVGEAAGLVLFLPGTGGTPEWVADDTHFPQDAQAARFAVAVPEGLPADPGRPSKFLTNPTRWNPGGHPDPNPLASPADDVAYLTTLVGHLAARGLVPTGRVGVAGFSNGAGMAYRFAAERSDLVFAVAPVAGHYTADATPERPVPTLALYGASDPLVPPGGGAARLPWGGVAIRPSVEATFTNWVRANRGDVAATVKDEEFGRAYDYPGPVPLRRIVLTDQGHHWPGGAGHLGERHGGPNRSRYSANAEIIAFFGEWRM